MKAKSIISFDLRNLDISDLIADAVIKTLITKSNIFTSGYFDDALLYNLCNDIQYQYLREL